jgi:uncharacterized membrane protein
MVMFMVRFAALLMLFINASYLSGQQPSTEKRSVDGIELEIFRNSESISQAIAINKQGSVIGTREVAEDAGATLRMIPFYIGTAGKKDIGVPKSYTNFEVVGLSDTELVIGYATRPLKHKDGSLIGAVWNAMTGEFALLPLAEGDVANQAQDISADGKRITGYTTGPMRMRPALWELDEKTQNWKMTVLPTLHEQNPYLMSGQLMISPNGKKIAGCCTERFRSDGLPDSSLFLWTEKDAGQWERIRLSEEQIYLRGINDHGEMAGSLLGANEGRQPCYVSPAGELTRLSLLPDDASGEAKDISNASVIVGFSDDPPGLEGGPELCIWSKDGKAKRLGESGASYGMILGINESGQMAGMIEVSPETKDSSATEPVEGLLLAFRTIK